MRGRRPAPRRRDSDHRSDSESLAAELTGAEVAAPAVAAPPVDADAAPDDIEQAILQLSTDAGAYVRCYRWDRVGREERWSYACRIPLAEFDPDQLRSRFGAGLFKVIFCRPDGTAARHVRVSFAPDAELPRAPAVAAEAAGALGGGSLMEKIFLQQLDFQGKLMLALVTRGGGGGGDLLEAVKLGQATAGSRSSLGDALEALQAAADLLGNRGGSAEGSDMPLWGKALGLLEKVLTPGGAASAAAPAPIARSAGTIPAGPAEVPPAAGQYFQLARKWAPTLLAEAQADRDPYVWGEFIAERIPAAFVPQVMGLVTAPPDQLMQSAGQVDPRLVEHRDWIVAAASAIRQVLTGGDDDPDPDATGPGRNNAGRRGDEAAGTATGAPSNGQADDLSPVPGGGVQ